MGGSGPGYGTFLGAESSESGSDLALDAAGGVHVAGRTFSAGFPTTAGAFDRVFGGDPLIFWGDAFVTRLGPGAGAPPPAARQTTGGAPVPLASSNARTPTVPASVTVPAGQTSAMLTVSTSDVEPRAPRRRSRRRTRASPRRRC